MSEHTWKHVDHTNLVICLRCRHMRNLSVSDTRGRSVTTIIPTCDEIIARQVADRLNPDKFGKSKLIYYYDRPFSTGDPDDGESQ
jgi:hypothetical protein